MKILVTGFEPFGGETINPAYEAVKLLPDRIMDVEIIKLEVPVVFRKGASIVEQASKEYDVDVILSIGQAGNRASITVEKVAINLADACIPDNEGNQPQEQPIQSDGDKAYFATIPVKKIVKNMRQEEIPAHVSFSAGTYVCNELMYQVLYDVDKKNPKVKAGFIHVPYVAAQVIDKPNGTPFMTIEMITKGILCAIETIGLHSESTQN